MGSQDWRDNSVAYSTCSQPQIPLFESQHQCNKLGVVHFIGANPALSRVEAGRLLELAGLI